MGEENGRAFIAMEHLDGVTLKHSISEQAIGFERLLDVAIQVTEGLDAAHGEGTAHRDIKPVDGKGIDPVSFRGAALFQRLPPAIFNVVRHTYSGWLTKLLPRKCKFPVNFLSPC